MLKALTLVAHLVSAPALVLDSDHRTARGLGYEILDEFSFAEHQTQPPLSEIDLAVRRARELCPRAQLRQHYSGDSPTRFVFWLWADRFSARLADSRENRDQALRIRTRAEQLRAAFAQNLTGATDFDWVDMSSPTLPRAIVARASPWTVRSPDGADVLARMASARAPGRVLIWINCNEPLERRGPSQLTAGEGYPMAQVGRDQTEPFEAF